MQERQRETAGLQSTKKASIPVKLDACHLQFTSRGFTFIELVLVVTIISTLTILSTGFYSRFLRQNAALNTVDAYLSALRKAQTYAFSGKQNDNWSVNFSANTITLYRGSVFAGHNTAFDEKYNVTSVISVAGLTNVTFARATGLPSSTGSITISNAVNNTIKTISVTSVGVATR